MGQKVIDVFRSVTKRELTVVLFAVILGFIGLASTDIYLPSMPSMAVALHATKAQIQLTIALFLIGCGVGQPFYGVLADRFGRKKIVVCFLFVSIIGFLLAALTSNIKLLLLSRFVQGLGAGVTLSLFRVLIFDVISGKRLPVILSYATIVFSLSPILAPVIGGYIEHFLNWRASFFALLLVYVIFVIAFWILCPETLEQKKDIALKSLSSYYKELFINKLFLCGAIAGGVGYGLIMAYATTAAFIFQKHFSLTPIAFGWLGVFIGAVSIVGKQVNAKMSLSVAIRRLLLGGFVLIFCAGLLLWLFAESKNFLSGLIPILVCVFGLSFIMGNAMVIAMINFQQTRGITASAYGTVQILIASILSGIIAHFAQYNVLTLGTLYIALGTLGVVLAFLL